MISLTDRLLNKITMYRLVLYYLIALVGVAAIFGAFGIIRIDPLALVFSVAILICVSLMANEAFARIFKAQPNSESAYITALILALIITPSMPTDLNGLSFLIWAAAIAMASKYILAGRKKHIFNPAAIAVAITALAFSQYASWWIGGNLPMLAFVLIGGLLVVRKIQKFDLVLTFTAAALVSCIAINASSLSIFEIVQKAILHTSLLFFAFVMLTEPLTTPPNRPRRIVYGAFVGLLFAPGIHIGNVYSTPELVLVAGNILSYILSPKSKHVLTLVQKNEVGKNLYDLSFTPDTPIRFKPGQYMEWTLGHNHVDGRGNRRYFTIASSPTEPDVHLGVKFADPSSSFKERLLNMKLGEAVVAGQLAGDFTLPHDPKEKLVFIAGGIGVTPFRSMVKYLVDKQEKRNVALFYAVKFANEIAYQDIFDEATEKIGMKIIYVITDQTNGAVAEKTPTNTTAAKTYSGRIDVGLISREVPDFTERTFYISGPRAMVDAFTKTLSDLGIPKNRIKTDFFPGF